MHNFQFKDCLYLAFGAWLLSATPVQPATASDHDDLIQMIIEPLRAYDQLVTSWQESQKQGDQPNESAELGQLADDNSEEVLPSDEERFHQLARRLFEEEYRSYDATHRPAAEPTKAEITLKITVDSQIDREFETTRFRPIQVQGSIDAAFQSVSQLDAQMQLAANRLLHSVVEHYLQAWLSLEEIEKLADRWWSRPFLYQPSMPNEDIEPIRAAWQIDELRSVFGPSSLPDLVEVSASEKALLATEKWETARRFAIRPFVSPQPTWYLTPPEDDAARYGARLSSQNISIRAR